jgi:hypothetical protein
MRYYVKKKLNNILKSENGLEVASNYFLVILIETETKYETLFPVQPNVLWYSILQYIQ